LIKPKNGYRIFYSAFSFALFFNQLETYPQLRIPFLKNKQKNIILSVDKKNLSLLTDTPIFGLNKMFFPLREN